MLKKMDPELQRREHARIIAEMREEESRAARTAPPPINVDAALALCRGAEFDFQGRTYVVCSVSYADGLTFSQLYRGLNELDGAPDTLETLERYKVLLEAALALVTRLARPAGTWRSAWRARLAYWLRVRIGRSPFLYASDAEVAALLMGFLLSRRTSTVTPLRPSGTMGRGTGGGAPSTFSTISPSSPATTRAS